MMRIYESITLVAVGFLSVVSCERKQASDAKLRATSRGVSQETQKATTSYENERRSQMRLRFKKNKRHYTTWMQENLRGISDPKERQAILSEALLLLKDESLDVRCDIIQEFASSEGDTRKMIRDLIKNHVHDEKTTLEAVTVVQSLDSPIARESGIKAITTKICTLKKNFSSAISEIEKHGLLQASEHAYSQLLDWHGYSNNVEQGISNRLRLLARDELPEATKNQLIVELSDGLARQDFGDALDFLAQRNVNAVDAWKATLSNTKEVSFLDAERYRDSAPAQAWQQTGASVIKKLASTQGIEVAWAFIEKTDQKLRTNIALGMVSGIEDTSDEAFLANINRGAEILSKSDMQQMARRLLALEKATESSAYRIKLLEDIINEKP